MNKLNSTLYNIPAQETNSEITVLNSRFIASIAPVESAEQARTLIKKIREKYADASHHVPAYIIGYGNSVSEYCSDDGEPSGTAGRPTLAVLRGSGLGDCCLVITRYFGGTLLGTGGLVKAYTEAAQEVVKIVPRARRVPVCICLLSIEYSLFERVKLLVSQYFGKILEQTFTATVNLTIQFPQENFIGFQHVLQELSNGQVDAKIIEYKNSIVPIK